MQNKIVPIAQIQARIHSVHGKRVMLDADLARFYGVTTFNLNKAVSRNLERFPRRFFIPAFPGGDAELDIPIWNIKFPRR